MRMSSSRVHTLTIAVISGENWTNSYYYVDSLPSVSDIAALFIVVFFALANFVLMSLFVAVILGNFEVRFPPPTSSTTATLQPTLPQVLASELEHKRTHPLVTIVGLHVRVCYRRRRVRLKVDKRKRMNDCEPLFTVRCCFVSHCSKCTAYDG